MKSPLPEIEAPRKRGAAAPAAPANCAFGAFRAFLKKELRAYFNSPVAYIVGIVFLSITGYFFAQPLFVSNLSTLDSFTDMAPLLLVFFVPAITMRLYAEEQKSGTFEVVSTLPVGAWTVLLAKYAAALALVAFTLAGTLAYPLTIGLLGRLDWGAAFGTYIGLFLTGAALAAIGLFTSSLTRNQIVAFILAFVAGFSLYVLGKLEQWMSPNLMSLVSFLGLDSHAANLGRGVVDSRDLLYYASLIGVFLFLTQVSVQAKRR